DDGSSDVESRRPASSRSTEEDLRSLVAGRLPSLSLAGGTGDSAIDTSVLAAAMESGGSGEAACRLKAAKQA
ncbi:putative integral membrane protein, partial [Toxoplasma gondii MAS]